MQTFSDMVFDGYTYQTREILDTLELFVQMTVSGEEEPVKRSRPPSLGYTVRESECRRVQHEFQIDQYNVISLSCIPTQPDFNIHNYNQGIIRLYRKTSCQLTSAGLTFLAQ